MNLIRKKVDSFTLTSYHPTKEWIITLSESSDYSLQIISGSYTSLQNINSFVTQNNIHYMINRMFYDQGRSAYYYSSKDIDNLDLKFLNSECTVIFIPKSLYGERIQAGSFEISSSSNTIKISDNYDGQLIDTNASSIVSDSNLVGWWSFDDGYKTNGLQTNFNSLSKIQDSLPAVSTNAIFGSGIQSIKNCISFTGDGYSRVFEYNTIKLEKSNNFSLSFWINRPVSQSVTSSVFNTIISKGSQAEKKYLFKLDLYNHTDATNTGKIKAYRKDRYGEFAITSSALTANQFNHVVFQKTGSSLQLYVNNTLQGTVTDATDTNTYFKDEITDLIFGGYAKSSEIIPELSGSLDEIRLYDKGLSTTEIGYLYLNPYNTNIIGNIYYSHGIAVINNQSGSYGNIYKNSSDSLKFNSVIKIRELRIECTKNPREFNFTLNPSIFVNTKTFENKELIPPISSSFDDFSPYITTIGLMNENQEFLAVAKLKTPLKANLDLPIKFVIRMDI